MPLHRSRCRRETTVEITQFKNERKNEYKASLSTVYIYIPAVVPAKLPGKPTAHFRITDQIQIRNVIKCIPVHCLNSVPLSRATNTQYCKLSIYPLQYNVLSCQSWNFPHDSPLIQIRPESLQLARNHVDEGPPVSSTGRSSLNCCFNCAGYGKLASGTHCASIQGIPIPCHQELPGCPPTHLHFSPLEDVFNFISRLRCQIYIQLLFFY